MKTNQKEIIEMMKNEVESYVDYDNFSTSATLMSQGVDSLDLNSLIFALEEKFEITIPDSDMEKLETVDGIVEYINKH